MTVEDGKGVLFAVLVKVIVGVGVAPVTELVKVVVLVGVFVLVGVDVGKALLGGVLVCVGETTGVEVGSGVDIVLFF